MPTIITVSSWEDADALTPTNGVVVKVIINGKLDGEFRWEKHWNPFIYKYYWARV